MNRYRYSGYDKQGALVENIIEAPEKASALIMLQQQGILVSDVKELRPDFATRLGFSQITLTDKVFLTRELSLLLEAGLKIDKGIALLAETADKPALKELLQAISADLKAGKKISQSFARHENVFDALYVNLLKIAEESGQLAQVFSGLADDLNYRQALSNKIKQAISYPLVILVVCILSITFIFNVVVPNLATMFANAEHLPVYTRALLGVSDFMQQYQWVVLFVLVITGYLFKRALKHSAVRAYWAGVVLKVPVLNQAVLQAARIRFNDALSLMLRSGIVIDKALQLAIESINNPLLRDELSIAADKISHGSKLSVALGSTRLFPAYFASILSVGEEAGELARIFTEIANRSRDNFNQWVSRMTTILEPLLILTMGIIVGSVVVVMMMSITATTDIAI